jgi:hypothetical protein
MKLMMCRTCASIISIGYDRRECACEACSARYDPDGLHVTYRGPAVLIGIANKSLVRAIANQPKSGMGERFDAFVIPTECETVTKESE